MYNKIFNRRNLLILGVLVVGIAGVAGSAAGRASGHKGEKRYQAEFLQLFDTVTQLVGYGRTEADFKTQASMIHDKLQEYDRLYDIYNDYQGVNNIKTINDQAGIAPVKVDQKIIDLLTLSKEMYTRTGGKMNVALGSVLSIWHDYRTRGIDDPEQAKLPPMELLKAASLHTDISKMIIDPAASTVYLADPEMKLDVGAIAKGYAVEQTALYAVDQGVANMLISVGGNVRAIGSKSAGEPWKVAVENPNQDGASQYLFNMLLSGMSLVSSGDYQRYYTVDGERYNHVINPDTLMPADYFADVTVLCQDSGLADGFSTALYTMTLKEGQALVEGTPGLEAVWVFHDGKQVFSSGFKKMMEKK